jgi:hypothetical protein
MLIRIKIWIGITMEIRFRIGVVMPIPHHWFLGQRIITTTRSHGTGLIQDTLNLLEPTEETLHRQKTPFCCSVADSDPGSGAFLTPESGIQNGKKTRSGSGMNNPVHISESLKTIFWVKNS